ncbi:serine/threonine protein kinase [Chitinimonas sp. BJYL2]|uniref:serine/threonine protein kinase n=1 Tax=Chitinimonas sp. BJYL2 TaxID=2976696 RepID=UPI0022B38C51|nr:serine/threonine protein kinase [Chitinimonas sp. BJYL2]
MDQKPPFADLTPDTLLDAIDALGLPASGSLLALNSYENRVYQVGIDDAPPIIAKIYRPDRWTDAQIQEEHTYTQQLAAAEIPVIAPMVVNGNTLHSHAGYKLAVFARRGGRCPEIGQPDVLEWIGRFLGRIHAIGQTEPFVHRPAIDIHTFGEEPVAWLLDSDFIPTELRDDYRAQTQLALDGVRRAFDRAGNVATLRLHGDCHLGNILWTDAGPHFVDFDDARTGPAVQDLWMLLGGEREEQSRHLGDLLAGYEDFCEFNTRELHLVEALRTLRIIHYAAWLARRWTDPAFPAAFTWFGTAHYWQQHLLQLREQIAQMAEPPLWSH